MLLKSVLLWISDIIWIKVLGGGAIKKQYKNRCSEVLNSLVSILGKDEPFILDGKWSWYLVNNIHYPINIVFPEIPLVVQVLGPEIGSWEDKRKFCKNKRAWELANRASNSLISVCEDLRIPLMLVEWGSPISPEFFKNSLSNILDWGHK